jgi:cobalt/nickel transport system permease protein
VLQQCCLNPGKLSDMHIPDGYLSPATCAALYAGATPFWYVSLQRVKKVLNTRLIPSLALFAAFSFVIMMFNIPLPGGTTGHAVGVAVAVIVLGPWAAILAISTALLIQAVFFGDGGITTFGANCFNMAIVGSLVAYGVYRAMAWRSPLNTRRRVIAAGLAGYAAINAAAFCAAIEFGIQPLLFRDATGAPLYAPYPLRVSVPAMMIGHLTLAGVAEFIISAGVVAYLQRANPMLLQGAANSGVLAENVSEPASAGGWRATKPLWMVVALLLLLTPLGVLAVGTAWGEWSAQDFATPERREQIASASRNQAPPSQVPRGLERLSSTWTAPFPGYAPSFIRSQSFGYILSGMFGTGLTIMVIVVAGRAASKRLPTGRLR